MLRFFRRIRLKLIEGGNLRKYLIYAIGEILLVMIGILLALQVNNWNEVRKQRIDEIDLLKDLRTDLEIKSDQMQEEYEISKKLNDNTIRFIMSLVDQEEEAFEMKEILKFGDYYPTNTHINSLEVALEGNTINIIRSDSLVNMLRKLKANLVKLEIDVSYMDQVWASRIEPFYEESGLSIHRFAFIYEGIAPDREILKDIDMEVFANKTSNVASIQVEWLKGQKVILDDMSTIIRLIQVELER